MSTQEVQTKVMDKKVRQKQREERKKIQMRYINKFQEGLPEYTQWEYTKQAMSAFFLFSMWSFVPILSFVVPIWLIFTPYWYLDVIYGVWLVYDWRTPMTGGRHVKWWRGCALWRNLALYYPIKLVKTVDLPPDRNYILGSHPHGFWCTGIFTHLLTDATNFAEEFPGLTPYLLTLIGQFWFPVRRDVGINMGEFSG
ncbi:hypothetical protein M3Y97_00660400 [Aphelenchoides bicaudatus]|nr:hypothetical protein M3Y97_00660400 [Aphelenchoides bicaudatus]